MNADQHRAEAERDIEFANEQSISSGAAGFFLARAQVHAALAQIVGPADLARRATIAEQWAVVTIWINSGPTVHGPFRSGDAASAWAADNLNGHRGCVRWDVVLMQDGDAS